MEHTPGPWEVMRVHPDGYLIKKPGWEIRTASYDVATWIEHGAPIRKEGDACLLAAAPDLLAACELAKKFLDAMRLESGVGNILLPFERVAFEQVDQVLTDEIAKAKGDQCSA